MKFSRNNTLTFQIPAEGYYAGKVIGWKAGKVVKTAMGPVQTVLITFDLGDGLRVTQSMLVFAGSVFVKIVVAN